MRPRPCATCGGERPPEQKRYCSAECRHRCGACDRLAVKNGWCDRHNFLVAKYGVPVGKFAWAPADAVCWTCGCVRAEVGEAWTSGTRRWCSARCEGVWRSAGGAAPPEGFRCADCTVWVPYDTGGKRRRSDSRLCTDCRGVTRYALTAYDLGKRDGWFCHLCDLPVDPNVAYPDPYCPTADHIVPRSQGGGHGADNLALAHLVCNSRRQALPLTQYRGEVVATHG